MGTVKMLPEKRGMSTPWGPAQSVVAVGSDGVLCVSTASHGGYFVPAGLLGRVSEEGRFYGRRWASGASGWFEEDCAWVYVADAFPELFPSLTLVDFRAALRICRDGIELCPGRS